MKGTGAQILVRYLEQEGVRVVFGVPGGHLLGLYDAFVDSKIAPVLAKHEAGAAFMAAGYAQVSGSLGVCCGTVGPGATNLVTGVAAAYMQSLPVLVITAQVGTVSIGKGALQEAAGEGRTFSQTELLSGVTKRSMMVTRADKLPEAIRTALRVAWAGRPGPVHLDLPADILRGEVDDEIVPSAKFRPTPRTRPSGDDLDRAATLLAQATKPAILAGGGSRRGEAPRFLLELAERLALPVATSLQGKGAIPEDHPLSLGCVGLYGTRAANRYMRSGLDVLLVVGSSLHEFTTHVWDPALQPATALIQVDLDPSEMGKNYPVDVALVGDAAIILEELEAAVERLGVEAPRSEDHLAELKESTEFFSEPAMRSDAVPTAPQRTIAEIQKALPDDITLSFDIGNSLTWVERIFIARRPDTIMGFGSLAAMGSGVAGIIGGKLAAPNRPAVVICGDGDFQMHGMEVMTAVNHDLAVIWIILENGTLGMIKDVQTMNYRQRYISSEFGNPDFVELAKAFGAGGYRAMHPNEIGPCLEQALASDRPAIVSIPIDGSILPPTKARMLAMERSLGLPAMHRRMGMGAVRALIGMLKER